MDATRRERIGATELTERLDAAALAPADAVPISTAIGRYRVLDLLGQGGMGRVYRAEQIEPVRRQVALKLMAGQHVGLEQRQLFSRECQTLARLAHPAIAQVFDADMTADGVPFMVMELVDGLPLQQYVAQHDPDLMQRVTLLEQVARGLEHAHRRRIIHCDIKPANILVTEIDGRPQPKLIDFGIARLLDGGIDLSRGGTPSYMSPEQGLSGTALDTRSDVYSLGIVLYELLSDQRLRDPDSLVDTPLPELARRFAAETPPALSQRGPMAGLPGRRRRELQAIVSRCLASEPEQRYPGAAALAEDLAAWQAHRPVSAVEAGPGYRLACLLRRQRLAAGLATVAAIALLLGLAGLLLGFQEARTQARIAEARSAELEQVVGFQQRLLGELDVAGFAGAWRRRIAEAAHVSPDAGLDTAALQAGLDALPLVDIAREVFDETVLAPAADGIGRDFADVPVVQARLRAGLGKLMEQLNLLQSAEAQLASAAELYQAHAPARIGERVEVEAHRANIERMREQWSAAGERIAAALALAEALPDDDWRTARLLELRGSVRFNLAEFEAARADMAAAAERYRAAAMLLQALQSEAMVLSYSATVGEACPVEARQRVATALDVGFEQPSTLEHRAASLAALALGLCEITRGAMRSAARVTQIGYQHSRLGDGEHEPRSIVLLSLWLASRTMLGEHEGLEQEFEAVQHRADQFPEAYGSLLPWVRLLQAELWSRQGRHTQALQRIDTVLASNDPERDLLLPLSAGSYRAAMLARMGRLDEARDAAERVSAECAAVYGALVADCLNAQAVVLREALRQSPLAELPATLPSLMEQSAGAYQRGHPYRLLVAWALHQHLLRQQDHEGAAALFDAELSAAFDLLPSDYAPEDAELIVTVQALSREPR